MRPLVCRLFGFAARRGGDGRPRASVCREISKHRPALAHVVRKTVEGGLLPPIYSDYSMMLHALKPQCALDRLPINTALENALGEVLLKAGLMGAARPPSVGGMAPGA